MTYSMRFSEIDNPYKGSVLYKDIYPFRKIRMPSKSSAKNSAGSKTAKLSAKNSAGSKTAKSAKNSSGSKTAKPSAKNSASSETAKLSAKNSSGSKTATSSAKNSRGSKTTKSSAKNSRGSKTAKSSIKNSGGSKTAKPKVQWGTIEGFSNYKISTDGSIYSYFFERCLKPVLQDYYRVNLRDDDGNKHIKSIGVLVATAFKKNPNNYDKVDHIDGNKLNNNVSNLRWFTTSLNGKHYHDNFKPKRAILQCDVNGNIIKKWACLKDILSKNPTYNIKTMYQRISECRSTYGFIWKYEKNIPKKQIVLENNEILKSIGIFEDRDLSEYQISNYGKIKNNKGQFLSSRIRNGYVSVDLTDKKTGKKNGYQLNRLVAHVFVSNIHEKTDQANHLDKNPLNNYYKNLVWTTPSGNMIHAIGIPVEMIDPITKQTIRSFDSITQANDFLKIKSFHTGGISNVCKGRRKTAYGYLWKFKEDIFDITMDELRMMDDHNYDVCD